MELIKPKEPLEFKYEDVVFLIKAQAVDADRMEALSAGEGDGQRIVVPKAEFQKALVRCFVLDWKGVTHEGKPVPYSYELLVRFFPPHAKKGHSVITELADFIVKHTDIFKRDEPEKKD